jgi:hypothetical protein
MQHPEAVRLLRRTLDIPLTPTNRKGRLPSAMGLVARGDRSRAIWLAMDRVLATPVRDQGADCKGACTQLRPCPEGGCRRTFVFPKDATEAAQAVVDGFFYANISADLSIEAVLKAWQRGWLSRANRTNR